MSKKLTPLRAIRKKCLDCSCFQPKEVRLCLSDDCSLFPYRLGKNPNRHGLGPGRASFVKKTQAESLKIKKDEALNG